MHCFNERIQINGQNASDEEIIEAFEAIQTARGEITLTYFEFATLAAFYLFHKHKIEIAVLEVGLGGRLDATNIVDANIAAITPIDLDHTNLLGNTITEIAFEKAGIIKPNALAISAENSPNLSIIQQADKNHATLLHGDKDFKYQQVSESSWQYQHQGKTLMLPMPRLQGAHQLQNSATAITVLLNSPIAEQLTESIIGHGLLNTQLKGRFEQVIHNNCEFYFDVTHNPQGAAILHDLLKPYRANGQKVIAVLGMLKDKDAANLASALKNDVDSWVLATLEGDRGQTASELKERILPFLNEQHTVFMEDSVANACQKALSMQQNDDIILVFGSFHTVSEGLDWITQR